MTLTEPANELCVQVGSVVTVSIDCGNANQGCRGPTAGISGNVLRETSSTLGMDSTGSSTSTATFSAVKPGMATIAPGPGSTLALGALTVTVVPKTTNR